MDPQIQSNLDRRGAPSPQEYLSALRRHKWLVVMTTSLAAAAALGGSLLMTPIYTAEAQVLVAPSGVGRETAPLNLEDERLFLASTPVAERVVRDLGYQGQPEELLAGLSVEFPPGATGLVVKHESPDPTLAQRAADAFARAYLAERRERALDALRTSSDSLESRLANLEAQLSGLNTGPGGQPLPSDEVTRQARVAALSAEITSVEQQLATLPQPDSIYVGEVIRFGRVPSVPSSPNFVLNGGLGLFIGFLLGAGSAFLRERLDDRVRGARELEKDTGVPVLAQIPARPNETKAETTGELVERGSFAAEGYNYLRTQILAVARRTHAQTVLITSPTEAAAQSEVTANLGVALAASEERVVMVSADLRHPRLHKFFNAEPSPGLSDVLANRVPLAQAAIDLGVRRLRLLTGGSLPDDPAALLGSRTMVNLLGELKGAADLVLLDSSSVLRAPDALALAPMVDVVALVVSPSTTRASVAEACRQLDLVGGMLVGTIVYGFSPEEA